MRWDASNEEAWLDESVIVLRPGGREELSTVDIDQIANLLLEASRRAELLADNSKEVFEPVHRAARDSLDELRILLDRALI